MTAPRRLPVALTIVAFTAIALPTCSVGLPDRDRAEPRRAVVEERRRDACPLGERGSDGASGLERALWGAVRGARFDEVIDLGPFEEACPGGPRCRTRPIAGPPSVDVAVIAFAPGCPPALANAMLSRDFPEVRLGRIDPETLSVKGVRFRRWDQARWDGPRGWRSTPSLTDGDDVIPAESAEDGADFFLPYPASNFKLLVAVKILSLVDRGAIRLEDGHAHDGRRRAIRAWLEDMITWSDDVSTQALLRRLHAIGEASRIDELFERLGLATLKIQGTSPATGRDWRPGAIHMGALDTAKLLWLLDPDAPAPTWRAPSGGPVDTAFLSPESKRLLLGLLHDQAFHDALSTTSLCGVPGVARGIPALLSARWIDEEGHARTHGGSAAIPSRCNDGAEVTFAHKTGLTLNFGSDAGIVRGIPGRARRHYIIAFFSNLGYRYADADRALGESPCHELGVCYTRRIAGMAAAIDAALEP